MTRSCFLQVLYRFLERIVLTGAALFLRLFGELIKEDDR